MTSELRITFNQGPAAGQLSVHVAGMQLPVAGQSFPPRPSLSLDADLLDRFRRRQLSVAEVADVTTKVNDWLLDPALRILLSTSLQTVKEKGNGGLRLVFVVPDETRARVADLPLELLWHEDQDKPLVLRKDVASISYLLSKVGPLADAPGSRTWPLKILIVRANPPDLNGLVPEVASLRDHILKAGKRYGPGMVQVDVISREAAIGRPATWRALGEHLRLSSDYSLLVYLGHGELEPSSHGEQPIGQLFMESEDGQGHTPVNARTIAQMLSRYPIPVVVLAGCMTAAQGLTGLSGGDQGVAQALVNSSIAGVQIAVGMRIELETKAATRFLETFFAALLAEKNPGNIDHAIWDARYELYQEGQHPPQWAAPVVFRASVREPFIDFLAHQTGFLMTPEMDKQREIRSKFWPPLAQQPAAQAPSEVYQAIRSVIDGTEAAILAEARKQGAALMPKLATACAGQDGEIAILLDGPVEVTQLRGRITLGGEGIKATAIAATKPQALSDAGFRLLSDHQDPQFFQLQSRDDTARVLPEGELLTLRVSVKGDLQPAIYPVTLAIEALAPKAVVWSGDNVLVVPRP